MPNACTCTSWAEGALLREFVLAIGIPLVLLLLAVLAMEQWARVASGVQQAERLRKGR